MATYGITTTTETTGTVLVKDRETTSFPVAATTKILRNSLVCINASGYAVNGADTASLIFVGVSINEADNTTGLAGAKTVTVRRNQLMRTETGSTLTIANIGANMFIDGYKTTSLTGDVSNGIFAGVLTEIESATYIWVDMEPAIKQADVATHIADTSAAHAASAISIADAGTYTAQTEVEAALQELYPKAPVLIADPGDAGAIPVTRSGNCALTSGATGETRTLAIPGVQSITIDVTLDVDGGGDAVITVASPFNQTGNNTITLGDAGDFVRLQSVQVASALVWRVVVNDGCTLATV